MEHGMFIPALVVGAALLSMWLHVRCASMSGGSPTTAAAQVAAGFVALQLLPGATSVTGAYALVFGLALPALVCLFLGSMCLLRRLSELLAGAAR
jgi:heme A synthase